MIPWLLQPAWASFTWQPRGSPLRAFFFLLSKNETKQTKKKTSLAGCLWVYCAFLFQPQRTNFIFPVIAPRRRLLLASDKVKQPALCYQGKGHLFKVSGLDGFWASKSQSLFSTHHFYSIGWKSDIQIAERGKERESEQQRSPFKHPCTAAQPVL